MNNTNNQKTTQRLTASQRHKKARNWKIIAGIAAIILVSILLIATHQAEADTINVAIKGKAIGDFTLQDINGQTVHLSDYQGKTVMLNGWATWCPPCRAEMPDLEQYYRNHKEDNFVILAINAAEPQEQAAAFAQFAGLTFPVLLDPDAAILSAMGINGFPTSILIDPQGTVKHIHIGMFQAQDLEKEISPFLQ